MALLPVPLFPSTIRFWRSARRRKASDSTKYSIRPTLMSRSAAGAPNVTVLRSTTWCLLRCGVPSCRLGHFLARKCPDGCALCCSRGDHTAASRPGPRTPPPSANPRPAPVSPPTIAVRAGTPSSTSGQWNPEVVVDRRGDLLAAAEVALGRLEGGVAEEHLDLLEPSAGRAAEPSAGSPEVVRRELSRPARREWRRTIVRTAAPVISVRTRSPFPIARKIRPEEIRAALVQERIASLTHSGTGTVRTRPPFPRMSAKTALPSRSWRSSIRSATSSLRRRAQPRRTARIARSRLPRRLPV